MLTGGEVTRSTLARLFCCRHFTARSRCCKLKSRGRNIQTWRYTCGYKAIMERASRSCLGIGDPCFDVIADASDHILDRFCDERGGSTLVDSDQQEQILHMLKEPRSSEADIPPAVVEVAGGSAANAMVCVAMLEPGMSCQYDPAHD